jgi:DNA-binding SARP family transcriptional activator
VTGEPAAGHPRTTIDLCGALRVEIAGRDVTARLPGRQGRVLFAFLVVNRHRAVARDELLHVLWPTDPPDAPEAGLSTVLARVRRALGDGVIAGRGELELRLQAGADVDVERAAARAAQAEGALARGEPAGATGAAREALEIVGRPLLPSIDGDWVREARGRLDALEPGLLEVLVRAALDARDREQLPSAERHAHELVERHEFRESGYELLMEVQARLGNVAQAMLTFDRARIKLREIGLVPSASLTALHEQLLRAGGLPEDDAPAPAAPRQPVVVPLPVIGGVAASTPFVGREPQLATLRNIWREACDGQRHFELLRGEPGVGKTRLAAQFAAELHAAGATVLYGRCDEEPLLAYQPFVEALRHYLRHGDWAAGGESEHDLRELSRLLPEARGDGAATAESFEKDPDSERYLLFQAVTRLIDRATVRRPLLLVLDDLHWADKPTLLLLRHMLRLSEPSRLMVLGIFREVEVDSDHALVELMADMRTERRFDRLALDGLGETEIRALVAARLAAGASDAFVSALRAQTDGNPFFVEEALRSLDEAQLITAGVEADERALASMGVPESVADVIRRRLGRVSDATMQALTLAAVVGREFDLAVVEALLDSPADEVIDAIEEAVGKGLVAEVAGAFDRFIFCHALVRDAIYDGVLRSRLLRLHLRVGEVLATLGPRVAAGPGELAHHFFLARELGVAAAAVRHCVQAGEEAARSLAYEQSAAHYARALEAFALDPDGDGSLRCDVLLAQGRVQWQAGEAAARETFFEAAASARARGSAQQLAAAALGLGERYWEAGAVDRQYHDLLAEALDTLPAQDSRPRARLMARMAENLHFTAEQEHGARLSLEALQMARRLGDVDTLKTALMGRHVALLHIEHLDERLALIDEVLALAQGHRPLTAEAHHWRLFDLCELGDVAAARGDHAELARLAKELRQPVLRHLDLGWEGVFAHLAGDVAEAERLAERSFRFGDRAQMVSAGSSFASMLFTLRRQQGRIAELVPSMHALETGRSASPAWKAALALAQVQIGEVDDGRARFERLAGADFSAIPRDWFWSITTALMAETCAALRDRERAPLLYALLEPFAERFVQVIFSVSWGSYHRYLGLLAGVMDRFDDAERHFEAALLADARLGGVLTTAETQCAYGALLLRRGRDGDAERAARLGTLAVEVAAPRGLHDLARRAQALLDARPASL